MPGVRMVFPADPRQVPGVRSPDLPASPFRPVPMEAAVGAHVLDRFLFHAVPAAPPGCKRHYGWAPDRPTVSKSSGPSWAVGPAAAMPRATPRLCSSAAAPVLRVWVPSRGCRRGPRWPRWTGSCPSGACRPTVRGAGSSRCPGTPPPCRTRRTARRGQVTTAGSQEPPEAAAGGRGGGTALPTCPARPSPPWRVKPAGPCLGEEAGAGGARLMARPVPRCSGGRNGAALPAGSPATSPWAPPDGR